MLPVFAHASFLQIRVTKASRRARAGCRSTHAQHPRLCISAIRSMRLAGRGAGAMPTLRPSPASPKRSSIVGSIIPVSTMAGSSILLFASIWAGLRTIKRWSPIRDCWSREGLRIFGGRQYHSIMRRNGHSHAASRSQPWTMLSRIQQLRWFPEPSICSRAAGCNGKDLSIYHQTLGCLIESCVEFASFVGEEVRYVRTKPYLFRVPLFIILPADPPATPRREPPPPTKNLLLLLHADFIHSVTGPARAAITK